MEITAEILFCLLDKKYPLQTASCTEDKIPVEQIRIYTEETLLEPETLYLTENGRICPETDSSLRCSFLCCSPRVSPLPGKSTGIPLGILARKTDPGELLVYLLELCCELRRWDAGFSEDIFRRKDFRKVMEKGRKFLEYDYSIIDLNMIQLYSTPGYQGFKEKEDLQRLPSDQIQALMLQPAFHAAAKRKGPFYYYDETSDTQLLCRNLLLDGQYYARIVMPIGLKGNVVSKGIWEIFELFSTHMERLIRYTVAPESRHTGDQLHYLFRAMAKGEKTDSLYCASVLQKNGWKENDTYTVIMLRFYEEPGWDSQLDTALPYLIREMEGEWPGSCAIIHETSLLWLINTSVSGEASGWEELRQKAAFFVRDHVCRAGISPFFRDFSLVPYGVKAAEAALEIGQQEHPEFWYYLFEDYRLLYMVKRAEKEISPALLRHPALEKLASYDRKHKTELFRTLEAYLLNNLNMTAAAEKLYIHRTTFCRRMDHIRRLTGLDISDPDTVLTLRLSYRLSSDFPEN